MLIIKNIIENTYDCQGTNSMFPDGNIPNIELSEDEEAIRFHDKSEEAQTIMSAHEYEIVDGVVNVIKTLEEYQLELKQTPEYKRQEILIQLAELDKIITRPMEQMYQDLNITPTYQPMTDAITQKQQLREQLIDIRA